MNRTNFVQTGGFPLKAERLKELQDAYEIFNGFTGIVADKSILSGCEVNGTQTANGIVTYNGEVFEFVGGTTQTSVVVQQDAISRQFQNGETNEVHYRRYITFGSGEDSIPWNTFKRASTIKVGSIIMWHGATDNLPAGYSLCNGTGTYIDHTGTERNIPDLRGRFIVGFNPDDEDYNAIGSTGGEKEHTLTEAEMPSHSHSGSTSSNGNHRHEGLTVDGSSADNGDPGEYIVTSYYGSNGNQSNDAKTAYAGSHTHTLSIDNTGGGEAHENRPPYYTLAYIIYVG